MRFLLPLTLLFACTSCNKSDNAAPEAQPETQTPGKTGTASITGTVTFKGTPPAAPAHTPTSDCSKLAGTPPPVLAISKSGGVFEAVVYVKDGLPPGKYPVPTEPVRLDQKGCEYRPRVFGARVGQDILLANSDPILHNVHGPGFNVPLPNAGATVTRKFERAAVPANVTCDVHPWMHAYGAVLPHPFFAITDEEGRFTIKNLPAGTYTIEMWQEKLGRMTQQVTVADGEAKTVAFEAKM